MPVKDVEPIAPPARCLVHHWLYRPTTSCEYNSAVAYYFEKIARCNLSNCVVFIIANSDASINRPYRFRFDIDIRNYIVLAGSVSIFSILSRTIFVFQVRDVNVRYKELTYELTKRVKSINRLNTSI